MFSSDRIFEQKNTKTGISEWFFIAREGVQGPHESREQALYALNIFKIAARNNHLTGGRDNPLIPGNNLSAHYRSRILGGKGERRGSMGANFSAHHILAPALGY